MNRVLGPERQTAEGWRRSSTSLAPAAETDTTLRRPRSRERSTRRRRFASSQTGSSAGTKSARPPSPRRRPCAGPIQLEQVENQGVDDVGHGPPRTSRTPGAGAPGRSSTVTAACEQRNRGSACWRPRTDLLFKRCSVSCARDVWCRMASCWRRVPRWLASCSSGSSPSGSTTTTSSSAPASTTTSTSTSTHNHHFCDQRDAGPADADDLGVPLADGEHQL